MSLEEIVDKIARTCWEGPGGVRPEITKDKLRKLPGGPTQPLTVHLRQEIDRLNIILDPRDEDAEEPAAGGGRHGGAERRPGGRAGRAVRRERPAEVAPEVLGERHHRDVVPRLLQRHDQLEKWLNKGRPKAYWLTGFFNPQGFLTAMKQEVNRKHAKERWALDDVVMTSEVTTRRRARGSSRRRPSEGVYVYGLFLEGCKLGRQGEQDGGQRAQEAVRRSAGAVT